MKINFKHRSNLSKCLYTWLAVCTQTVSNSHRPVNAYRKLPEFAIKLQKQKLFKPVIIKAISAFAQNDGARLINYLFFK